MTHEITSGRIGPEKNSTPGAVVPGRRLVTAGRVATAIVMILASEAINLAAEPELGRI